MSLRDKTSSCARHPRNHDALPPKPIRPVRPRRPSDCSHPFHHTHRTPARNLLAAAARSRALTAAIRSHRALASSTLPLS
ncbi:MAG: hypothetical protein LBI02_07215 [Opitutaceae bacterium]|nr:hypothetical protein [Opitutaceae bacterium]